MPSNVKRRQNQIVKVTIGDQEHIGVQHSAATEHIGTHWSRLLQPAGDLVSVLLQDCYGASLDWIHWQTPQRGDSAFMSSLRPVFALV